MQYLSVLAVLASTALFQLPVLADPWYKVDTPEYRQPTYQTDDCEECHFVDNLGRGWTMFCHTDLNPGYDIAVNYEYAYDYESCAQSCEDYNTQNGEGCCTGAVWEANTECCFLKSGQLTVSYKSTTQALIPDPVPGHP